MNLQINSPYKMCPYNCPFCIAAKCPTSIFSDELYNSNLGLYITRLIDIIKNYDITTVVLTGDTEPTLFPLWIEQVKSVAKAFNCKVEIQTRNHNFRPDCSFDVVAYSCTTTPPTGLLKQRANIYIKRYTLLLTDEVSDDEINELLNQQVIPRGEQLTIKYLRPSAYGDPTINQWIETHKRELSEENIAALTAQGVRVDKTCDESEGRYLIYRTNGKLYQHWNDTEPLE